MTPFYRKKFKRDEYLMKGMPVQLTEALIPQAIPDWIPPSPEEMLLWEDAKEAALRRRKKQEYLMTYEEPRLAGFTYSMQIEVLHINHVGFQLKARNMDGTELQKWFWPTVQKLLAHYFSPRVLHDTLVDELDGILKQA